MEDYIKKFNAEDMGTKLLALVGGKKAYIADMIDGKWVLNELGLMLEDNMVSQTEGFRTKEETAATSLGIHKRRGRPPKVKPEAVE